MTAAVITLNKRERLWREAVRLGVPPPTATELTKYVVDHTTPGGAMRAIISGDLFEAYHRADDATWEALDAIMEFLWTSVPEPCVGSREKMLAWIGFS